MKKKDILQNSLNAWKKHLNSLSPDEINNLRERLIDKTPKGWLSIDEYLPKLYIKDLKQGYSVFKVRDKDGNEFDTQVTDHMIWFYEAKEVGITHWLNK